MKYLGFIKKTVFENCEGYWILELPSVIRKYDNVLPASTKLTNIHQLYFTEEPDVK